MTSFTFLECTGFAKELYYMSQVDYEKKFHNLDEETIKSLSFMTDNYFTYIKNKKGDLTLNIPIKKDGLNIDCDIYCIRYEPLLIIKTEYCGVDTSVQQLSLLVSISKYGECNYDLLKNSIYNLLFYIYVFKNEFVYSSCCKFYHNKYDIDNIIKLNNVFTDLFNEHVECCVCLEPVNKNFMTKCNHPLCLSCFKSLKKELCPMCRKCLSHNHDDESDDEE